MIQNLKGVFNQLKDEANRRDLKDGARFYLTLGNIEGRLAYKSLIDNGRKEGNEETTQA